MVYSFYLHDNALLVVSFEANWKGNQKLQNNILGKNCQCM